MHNCFLHKRVSVLTPTGKVEGILLNIDYSRHKGLGTLILKDGNRLLIVKNWRVIAVKAEG